jgi:siroheme synthase (precorrin-2 oxidase/ferrochelatase)
MSYNLTNSQVLVIGGGSEDIAHAVLFLATTPFATGSTVRVDGGGAIA